MRIADIRFTDGPNYWSVQRRRLIVMTLDLEEMENHPTHKIPGFYERLKMLVPSLQSHRCSEGTEGGFFTRVQRGTWMGHVIEHLALELQTLAGIETGFGRTRDAGKRGLYHVVYSCKEQASGRYAGEAAVRIAKCLAAGIDYDLTGELDALRAIYERKKPGPSTQAIVDSAQRKNIPVLRLNDNSLVQLGYGAASHKIEAAVADTTSNMAVALASDKEATRHILASNGIPVPCGDVAEKTDDVSRIIEKIGYPVVVKPVNANHGRGVTTDIIDPGTAMTAFENARTYSDRVIIEKFISGSDFRVLVINYKLVAAALRTPASVTGNGKNTVAELITVLNDDPRRGAGHANMLTKVSVGEETLQCLLRSGLDLDSVLPAGKTVQISFCANLSTGGTAMDVTDTLHPANTAMFERIARIIGLNICGIDIIAPQLCTPIVKNGGGIIEVNAGPGLRMHLSPNEGQPRNVADSITDMLFSDGNNGRIPIIAVTGTNGKTTTTRLTAHIMRMAGYQTGYTTTDGIYIGDNLVEKGDCTGPLSARVVLADPWVNCAVLECARGGILRGGLGFDACDVAVITNIAEDHLGQQGIDSIEKLARIKAVVAESVMEQGYVILNADDEHVYRLYKQVSCGVILFSMKAGNDRIRKHVWNGGSAVVYENGLISIIAGGEKIVLCVGSEIPVTFNGSADFNIANCLAAAAAAWAQGVTVDVISWALRSFIPSCETLPGRMNIFSYKNSTIIVDYAHNTHGIQSVAGFILSLPAMRRIGVIAGVGDRRDEDIISFGREAAIIFDEIIIRQDSDLRGRTPENINGLLCSGIRHVDNQKKITVIPDECLALDVMLQHCGNNTVAVFFADDIAAVTQRLQDAVQSATTVSLTQNMGTHPDYVAA